MLPNSKEVRHIQGAALLVGLATQVWSGTYGPWPLLPLKRAIKKRRPR